MKKLLLIMFCMIFLIGIASAELTTLDNKKIYNEETQTVTIKNTFGFGRDISKIQLNTPLDYKVGIGHFKVAELRIELFDDNYTDVFGIMKFYNLKDSGNEINREFEYKYKTTKLINVNDYAQSSCSKDVNGTTICNSEIIGTHEETREDWKSLDSFNLIKGNITIGIFTTTQNGDHVEWIPTLFNKKIDEFASWTSDLNTDLIAYYKMDEGSGVVIDSFGPWNGTNVGADNTTGIIKSSYNFIPANSDRISVSANIPDDNSSYSISFWAYIDDTGTNTYPIHKNDYFQISGGNMLWRSGLGTAISPGQWYHFVGTNDGAKNYFYKDGSLVGTNAGGSFTSTANTLFLGARANTPDKFYDGKLDEIGFWARNITAEEVTQLYNGGAGISFISTFPASVILNSPINHFNTTNPLINFNSTVTTFSLNLDNVTLFINDVGNDTNVSGTEGEYIFTKSFTEQTSTWLIEGCNVNSCTNSSSRSFTFDISSPILNITSPTEIVNYHLINANLSINWTVSDITIDTCILEFEEVNKTVTCIDNSTEINITNSINKSVIFYANDTFGNVNSTSRSWNYTVFENSRSFSTSTLEGTTELFKLNYSIDSNFQTSKIDLIYNGTKNSAIVISSAGLVTATNNLLIPQTSSEVNVSFFWNITLTNGLVINTTTSNQTIGILSLDDCSTNTNLIYNYTLNDEETQLKLSNTSIEIEVIIFDISRTSSFINFSKAYNLTDNPAQVCLNTGLLTATNYSLDSTVRYTSNDSGNNYEIEYYNIINFTLSNSSVPKNTNLYDLKTADSTEFQLTFKDSNLALFPNILVHVDRKYVEDHDFKTVEIPVTDSNGQTVLHLVRNDIVYNFIMVNSAGEIVATFNKIIAFCQDFTIGDCSINLNTLTTEEQVFNSIEDVGISYTLSYSNTTDIFSLDFVATDLETKTVLFEVLRNSDFGNRTVCQETLVSSSGTIDCDLSSVSDTDRFLFTNIYVGGSLKATETIDLEADNKSFGVNGFFIAFLFILFLITMFMEDKQILVISLGIGWVTIISLGLVSGSLFGSISAGIWLVITIIIFIWKLKKERI